MLRAFLCSFNFLLMLSYCTPNNLEEPVQTQPETPPQPIDEDSVIREANKHVEKAELFEAVQLFRKIPANSAQASYAQFRIKQLSDRAVHELRSKAATAFAQGRGATSPDERRKQFETAEALLKEALARYPETDKRSVIESNLKTIREAQERDPR